MTSLSGHTRFMGAEGVCGLGDRILRGSLYKPEEAKMKSNRNTDRAIDSVDAASVSLLPPKPT